MANFIPQEILDEIMQRADIMEVVGDYVQLRRRGRNWFGLCPFHNEDTASFSVNPERQIYKCFGCGKGGNAINFVQEIEHLTFGEAARMLAQRYHVEIPERALSPEEQRRAQRRQSLLAIHEDAAHFMSQSLPASKAAQNYLTRRGIDADSVRRFGLGFAPEENWHALYDHLRQKGYSDELLIAAGLVSKSAKNGRCYDKFHGRLIFPIRDHRSRVVAFGGRSINGDEPKYLNSQTTEIYNKSNLLFALDLAADAIRSTGQVVIMEGYMDVLSAHWAGVENCVASLGTAFTPEQARLLTRYAPEAPKRLEIVLAFDGDAAGIKAARLSLEKLQGFDFLEPKVAMFPAGMDPDDFFRKEGVAGWQRLLKESCLPMLDYLLFRAVEQYGTDSAAAKGQVVRELLPALRRVKSSTEQASFIRQMAKMLQVSEEAIRMDIASGKTGEHTAATPAKPGSAGTGGKRLFRPGKPANRQLLLMALSDREIWHMASGELGADFASTPEEAELIAFVEELSERYPFEPSALFNFIGAEQEGLRQFLLKLLEEEMPVEQSTAAATDYIRTIRGALLKQKLAELQRQIQQYTAQNQNADALLQEKMRLTIQLKTLGTGK